LVSASHTLGTGELMMIVAFAMNPWFIILESPVNTSASTPSLAVCGIPALENRKVARL